MLLLSQFTVFNRGIKMSKKSRVTFNKLPSEISSDSEEDNPGPNTQAILEEVCPPSPAMEVSNISTTLLETVELLWEPKNGCKLLIAALNALRQDSVKKRNLIMKRFWENCSREVLAVMKNLKKLAIKYENCSWTDFERGFLEEKSSMTYMSEEKETSVIETFIEQWEQSTKEQSSLLRNMDLTTTSSMTAPTPPAPADVLELKPSETSAGSYIDELFGPSTSRSNTGSISWSISRQTPDGSCTWKLPVKSGLHVVKLEVYPFEEVKDMDRKNWWKKASTRMLFTTSSTQDVKEVLVQKTVQQVAKEVLQSPESKKEVRATNFWSS